MEYPAVIIDAHTEDFRTPLWGILKYVKKFREVVGESRRVEPFCDKNILLRLGKGSHLGSGDSVERIEDSILVNSFFNWVVEEKSLDVVGRGDRFSVL